MKIAETKRVILRKFCADDLYDVNEFSSQPEIEMMGWCAHESVAETKRILNLWIAEEHRYAIVDKNADKVIGYLVVGEDSGEAREDTRELGFALNRLYHGQGIMSEALHAVLELLFSREIAYVWACCYQNNISSRRLIEKKGFTFMAEGVFYSQRTQTEEPSFKFRMTKDNWMAYKKTVR